MSLTTSLQAQIAQAIRQQGGWLPFDAFMALALYAPGLGYYAGPRQKLGTMPQGGSDFVTAPELSPLFGQTLSAQVAQALQWHGVDEVWEFGAGTGALADQVLTALGDRVANYRIVELSADLQARQRERLGRWGDRVSWVSEWPDAMRGVVIGNEVLDAMPVKLLQRAQGKWHERGVALGAGDAGFEWQDRPTELRPPMAVDGDHDYLCEIHPQAEAFVRSLADRLTRSAHGGTAFLIDYGFTERNFYHPQRHMGTLMCHRAHRSDPDPLSDVGEKDITAHVNFTGIAVAAQDAGLNAIGYCNQARFLLNCGMADRMAQATLPERANAQKLVMEHEMGELFKVLALSTFARDDALGFVAGDRTHTL